MRYLLVWPYTMIQRLAALYLMARANGIGSDFTRAVADIEAALRQSPRTQGESRGGDDRIIIVSPVGVTYRVDEAAKKVYVIAIGYSPGR